MKIARREFLRLAAGAATIAAAPRRAGAQNYPTRLLHIVSPASAGKLQHHFDDSVSLGCLDGLQPLQFARIDMRLDG